MSIGAVDAWATINPPEVAKAGVWPKEIHHIFKKYGTLDLLTQGYSEKDMLKYMDDSNVEISVISAFGYGEHEIITNEMVAKMVKGHPDRFVGSGTIDPRGKPMKVLAELKHMVEDLNLRILRLEPYAYGDGMVGAPPNQKMYWPIYAKCCEYDIPVAIQVGHTGPLLPSEAGRPIYLDEVALSFPDMTILGCHLGQPWTEEMMILAWKHPNVYVETSARTPKHWPKEFVHFCKKHGQDKVIWATDFPLLSFKRTLAEIDELGFTEDIKKKVIRTNALKALKIKI